MKKILLSTAFILFNLVCFSQSIDSTFENYKILNVGYISIPNNMEIQSGNYKKLNDSVQKQISKKFGYEVSDDRVVFQQKGLNTLSQSAFNSYARVILETEIGKPGDYEKLTTKVTSTEAELAEINNAVKLEISKTIKLITWNGVSIVTINGRSALKISYVRQIGDNPSVWVDIYRFQNNDRMHSLTLSYRQTDVLVWKPLFAKILKSYTITSIR